MQLLSISNSECSVWEHMGVCEMGMCVWANEMCESVNVCDPFECVSVCI